MKLSNKGFTLSELLLATAILAFVLVGLLALFINCTFLNDANRNLTTASSHAEYIMEEIRNTSFSSVEPAVGAGNWDLNEAQISSAPYNLTALKNEQIDTNVIQSGNPLGISVRVTWNDRGQRPRYLELRTYLTNLSGEDGGGYAAP